MHQTFQNLLFLLILVSACNVEAPQSTPADVPNRYYDLHTYFEQEIERLNKEQPAVSKTVILNGEKEEQTVKNIDFADEFLIFRESHINKVSWWGKYEGDTTYYNNEKQQIKKIRYTTDDEELKTKVIHISFSPAKQIDSLYILNATHSPTISTKQELIYVPKISYEIFSREKVALSKNREVMIKGIFE